MHRVHRLAQAGHARRIRDRARRLLSLVALAIAVTAPAAHADPALITKLTSRPCAGTPAVTWRMGYQLYWSSTAGHITTHAADAYAINEAQAFVDGIAADSQCALRGELDVYDMGGTPFPAGVIDSGLPTATEQRAFRAAHAYDALFMRYPANGNETFAGRTHAMSDTIGGVARRGYLTVFPVRDNVKLGIARPHSVLLLHEWMHAVVDFYPAGLQGWPIEDVHGGQLHGYRLSPKVNESYFAAMLQGKVIEPVGVRGMTAAEYALDGTPTAPLRTAPTFRISHAGTRWRIRTTPTFDGVAVIRQVAADGAQTEIARLAGPDASWVTPDGRSEPMRVCVDSAPGSARFRPIVRCLSFPAVAGPATKFTPSPATLAQMPLIDAPARLIQTTYCIVPRVLNLSRASAARNLARAGCTVGTITARRGKGKLRVRKQSVVPGVPVPAGTAIALTVGPRKKR